MRYLALIALGVIVAAGLMGMINVINNQLLENYLNEWSKGYAVGILSMIVHNVVLLKWYKKEL